jgi:hypothetical protein
MVTLTQISHLVGGKALVSCMAICTVIWMEVAPGLVVGTAGRPGMVEAAHLLRRSPVDLGVAMETAIGAFS